MSLKPCLICGEPSDQSRCPEHRTTDQRRHRGRGHANDDPRWRRLSGRIRRLVRFCEWCGTTTDLTVDHIIPSSEAPGLIYTIENLRVLCRTCNSRRGSNVTDTERNHVYAAIGRRERRATRGMTPTITNGTPAGKAQGAMNLTGVEF